MTKSKGKGKSIVVVETPGRRRPSVSKLVRKMAGRGDYSDQAGAALESRVNKLEHKMGSASGLVQAAAGMVPKGSFESAGSSLGGLFGPLGSKLGSLAGRTASSVLGFGDYDVQSNTLIPGHSSSSAGAPPPIAFTRHGKRGTRIVESEFIGDVLTGNVQTFLSSSYALNPGVPSTFPWLSAVASQFEEYEFLGLIFEFRTTSSEITSGIAMGSVIMATSYDALNSSFLNKLEMESSDYANSAKPSQTLLHGVECAPQETSARIRFVRSGAPPTTGDLKSYDFGNFQLATVGVPSTTAAIGELWVHYDVVLYKKILYGGILGNSMLTCNFVSQAPTTVSAAQMLGTGSIVKSGTLACTWSGATLTFPTWLTGGTFLVAWQTAGGGASNFTGANPTLVGCTSVVNTSGGPYGGTTGYQPSFYPSTATASLSYCISTVVRITAATATVAFTGCTVTSWHASTTSVQLLVVQLPTDPQPGQAGGYWPAL